MDTTEKNAKDYYVVDMAHVVKAVWHRFWVVVLASILTGAIGFALAAFVIAPTYSSSVMLYVNNSSINVGDLGLSISSSDLTAAQSLAKTYTVLLKNRTSLSKVIEHSGLDYDWKDVYDMIDSGPVDETEVLQITVTCGNAEHAYRLASSIAHVLRNDVVPNTVKKAEVEIVDHAYQNSHKVAPSITNSTILGGFLGAFMSIVVLVILALMDNTIHDEEFIIENYDYPILAKIPGLASAGSKRYGYKTYYRYGSYDSKGGNNNG